MITVIDVLTATRAEYGLLKPIVTKLSKEENVEVRILVTGAHLSPEFGLTYQEIESDGFEISVKIPMLLSSDTPSSISKSMGLALIGFADYFQDNPPNALIVLGDRYETIAVALAAMNKRIPIIHLYGGEITIGAIDDAIRHAITKISILHLTSTEQYRNRVIQLGENPSRVFNVGAIGVENALNCPTISLAELSSMLGFDIVNDFFLVTFHPVTLDEISSEEQIIILLEALNYFPNNQLIFTKANADAEGRIINELILEYCSSRSNAYLVDSLGQLRYLNAAKYAKLVIGNSSSGIIEVPSLGTPTINIGDRQKGRLKAESVFDCPINLHSIVNTINKAQQFVFTKSVNNPYGNGKTTKKITEIIMNSITSGLIEKRKVFYDLE